MNKPRDNSDLAAKIAVRAWALRRVGGLAQARVLELYGGEGHLYDACYRGASAHLSFDRRPIDGPARVVGDNRALLPAFIDAAGGWNLFDADAYASPWLVLADVARLRRPGVYAAVATCGLAMAAMRGRLTDAYARQRIGWTLPLKPGDVGFCTPPLLHAWYADLVRWIVSDWRRFGVRVVEATRCPSRGGTGGSRVWYWAFLLLKKPAV